MPGLLRGIARTAVVAGTATAVSNRVSRRQAERWQSQGSAYMPGRVAPGYGAPPPQEYAPEEYAPPPPEPAADPIQQLKDLAALRDQGVLTDEEFAAQKAKLLG
jgi:hypothetical protein